MFAEDNISRKTRSILDSYRELVGGNVFITIDEYLRTRELAVSELKAGIGTECAPSLPVASAAATVPETAREPKPGSKKATGTAAKSSRGETEQGSTVTPKPAPPAQKSDYEILRGLSDPWN